MMLRADALKHGPKIDGGSVADMIKVCRQPILGGLAPDIAEMDEKSPFGVDLRGGAERLQFVLVLDHMHPCLAVVSR